jgi:hypothetical protein
MLVRRHKGLEHVGFDDRSRCRSIVVHCAVPALSHSVHVRRKRLNEFRSCVRVRTLAASTSPDLFAASSTFEHSGRATGNRANRGRRQVPARAGKSRRTRAIASAARGDVEGRELPSTYKSRIDGAFRHRLGIFCRLRVVRTEQPRTLLPGDATTTECRRAPPASTKWQVHSIDPAARSRSRSGP